MGTAGVKVYDTFSRVLRVETTVNDLGFFQHHRKVEHKDRHVTRELAPLKKTIYSLIDLREMRIGNITGLFGRIEGRQKERSR